MKNRKASGIEAISADVLNAEGEPMVRMLHTIFNLVWKTEQTHKNWAQMLVTPIHKKSDKLNPANYRAIFL